MRVFEMRRRRNPFGDDVADFLIIGALGVGAYLVYRYFYPSQSDTAPGTPVSSPGISTSLSNSVNNPFGSGSLLSPASPSGIDMSSLFTNANPFGPTSLTGT